MIKAQENKTRRWRWPAACLILMAAAGCMAGTAPAAASPAALPAVAFYYGTQPPVNALQAFDWVVVDGNAELPESVSGVGPGQAGTRWFAYLSLGEVADGDGATAPPPSCVIGNNQAWKGRILDLRSDRCRDWLWQQRVDPLLARGFQAFFLDTLDSYQLALSAPQQRDTYRAGMVAMIKRIRARVPGARFILNRGFELLDTLKGQGVVGVAAESMYRGWDQANQTYTAVKPADSQWLKDRLDQVKTSGLVPIAIDYVADNAPELARKTADRIAADGFVPYVTNGQLNRIGSSQIRPEPRQILMLYDGSASPLNTNANWYAAMVLNHMGYATRALNVDIESLPQQPMTGRVAGIVTWFSSAGITHGEEVHRWLRRQIDAGIPVAILDEFGFPADATHLAPFGIKTGDAPSSELDRTTITHSDPQLIGFETPPLPSPDDFRPLQLIQGQAALTLARDDKQEDAVAITRWGGYALTPHVIVSLPAGTLDSAQSRARWVLNPFTFFRQALRLGDVPAFDTTTASGNRLLFAHFDGDGFASLSFISAYYGKPAAQVILDAVLKRYAIPTAASVIASEFSDGGLYGAPELSVYRPIARAMFALPWVEIGSHTFSHPFDWGALERDPGLSAGLHLDQGHGAKLSGGYLATANLKYGYNLPVPGYRFSAQQEVAGSVKIIQDLLAPVGKPVTLYQWSGDTNPDAAVVALTYQAGLLNINGNNSTINDEYRSLTNVAPLGVWKGAHFQVFAPDANEDQFTNGWSAPYCGYRKVLQTFRMTESPRRLAPINIYYHVYSGAHPCALAALQSVYDWAIAQPVTPVYPSYYSRIALGFEYAGMARDGDTWVLAGYGADQTVRIAQSQGYPDLSRSENIAGFNDVNDARYISLGPDRARLLLTSKAPSEPYLVHANALVSSVTRGPGTLSLDLRGEVPLQLALANANHCQLSLDGHPLDPPRHRGLREVSSPAHGGRLDLVCPR